MPDNESRMDDELHARGEAQSQWERFIEDEDNRDIAAGIMAAWDELNSSYREVFGDNADIRDEMTLDDLKSVFKL